MEVASQEAELWNYTDFLQNTNDQKKTDVDAQCYEALKKKALAN